MLNTPQKENKRNFASTTCEQVKTQGRPIGDNNTGVSCSYDEWNIVGRNGHVRKQLNKQVPQALPSSQKQFLQSWTNNGKPQKGCTKNVKVPQRWATNVKFSRSWPKNEKIPQACANNVQSPQGWIKSNKALDDRIMSKKPLELNMFKCVDKKLNSNPIHSCYITFDDNWHLHAYENYFIISNKNDLSTCWLAISDNFSKCLVLSGKCELNIIHGALEINGVLFNAPFNQKIYSPTSHAKVTFRIKNSDGNVSCNFERLISIFIENNDNNSDFTSLRNLLVEKQPQIINENWNLFKLNSFLNHTIEDVTQFKEFRNLFDVDFNFPFAKKLKFSLTASEQPEYNVSSEMKKCLDIINSSSNPADIKVAVVGPKNSGKSSFLKTLTNEMFNLGHKEICIIDGDPGQCEFSTCGTLSLSIVSKPLFGPPFTHQFSNNVEIKEQCFLGLLSPNDDPKLYCRSFERLYHKYLSICSGKQLPLIINTMGWLSDIGLLLLAFKLLLINPSHIIQLKKGKDRQDLTDITPELIEKTCNNCNLFENLQRKITSTIFYLKSQVSQNQGPKQVMNPWNHRDLTALAYLFHQTENQPKYSHDMLPKDYDHNPVTRLRCRVPVVVKYIHQSENFESNNSDGMATVKLELVYSEINENINQLDCITDCFIMQWVAICRPVEPCHYDSVINESKFAVCRRNEKGIMFCVGMGLVLRVRKENNEMDLLTGLERSTLNGCYLVKGKIFPPEMLFLNQREILAKHNNYNLPYLSPLIPSGIGRTATPTRKSLPKIRRHHHKN